MAKRLATNFIDLVYSSALRSFWRRKALARFLRQHGVSENFLAAWSQEESKRDLLDRLFAKLQTIPGGQKIIINMARDLTELASFPDLMGWEDSEPKIEAAEKARNLLRMAVSKLNAQERSEKDRREAQERFRDLQAESRRSQETLKSLDGRLKNLSTRLGSQQAGYDFQVWFYDLMNYFEIVNRRPYTHGGRQIDGSLTVSGTTYLVELKFTGGQIGANEIDSLHKKVADKADNTMGIMVSISGYSSVAIAEASGPRALLLLLDHTHLYLSLSGIMDFSEIIDRARRHASQTGESYLPGGRFGV